MRAHFTESSEPKGGTSWGKSGPEKNVHFYAIADNIFLVVVLPKPKVVSKS